MPEESDHPAQHPDQAEEQDDSKVTENQVSPVSDSAGIDGRFRVGLDPDRRKAERRDP